MLRTAAARRVARVGLAMLGVFSISGLLGCGGCGGSSGVVGGATKLERPSPPRWLKGQLHLHSANSGDSRTPPADVVRWYEHHDYDFIVVTDHNYVTVLPSPSERTGMLVIPGVELTQNLRVCEPPPAPGSFCPLHVNALFVEPSVAGPLGLDPGSHDRREIFAQAVRRANALGGLAQINHPNFHYAADAELLGQIASDGAELIEIANEAVDSNNGGDGDHPSTMQLWDALLTEGHRLWGTATDDAHHYEDANAVRARGAIAHVGDRGWVEVFAAPEPGAIREALREGHFYATTGVVLTEVLRGDGSLAVGLDPHGPEHEIRFIGAGGRVLRSVRARRAAQSVTEGYVRAVVVHSDGRRAWTQPAFVAD